MTPSAPAMPRASALKPPPKKEEGPTNLGKQAPVTPPKAVAVAKKVVSPKKEEAGAPKSPEQKATTAKSGVKVKPTPRSPPPIGLSGSESTSGASQHSDGRSKSEEKEEKEDREASRSRTPLERRPYGAKQRKKAAQGNFGKVRFEDPVASVVNERNEEGGVKGKEGGKSKGKSGGKFGGKQKGKGKGKKGQKGKSKQGKSKTKQGKGSGEASPRRSGDRG